jgi:hypothetical protein
MHSRLTSMPDYLPLPHLQVCSPEIPQAIIFGQLPVFVEAQVHALVQVLQGGREGSRPAVEHPCSVPQCAASSSVGVRL